jgi:DNA modification methylase
VAAARLGRRYVGLDLSMEYLRMSQERLEIGLLDVGGEEVEAVKNKNGKWQLKLFGD